MAMKVILMSLSKANRCPSQGSVLMHTYTKHIHKAAGQRWCPAAHIRAFCTHLNLDIIILCGQTQPGLLVLCHDMVLLRRTCMAKGFPCSAPQNHNSQQKPFCLICSVIRTSDSIESFAHEGALSLGRKLLDRCAWGSACPPPTALTRTSRRRSAL